MRSAVRCPLWESRFVINKHTLQRVDAPAATCVDKSAVVLIAQFVFDAVVGVAILAALARRRVIVDFVIDSWNALRRTPKECCGGQQHHRGSMCFASVAEALVTLRIKEQEFPTGGGRRARRSARSQSPAGGCPDYVPECVR